MNHGVHLGFPIAWPDEFSHPNAEAPPTGLVAEVADVTDEVLPSEEVGQQSWALCRVIRVRSVETLIVAGV